ncbi:hypothetical protein FGO68_gene17773 [Halteria grandinella]|uniref:Mitochondrial import inner membrane translocase subunit TIM50 n=1 Tax=Halteria grandinella TaxID=5974 RepID=A0A8J8T0E4_HALGN|nr:hypothetical protein FGO68_gene17773 [Halteria grandinella]
MQPISLVQEPFLPPISPEDQSRTYTLVLDLSETLCTFKFTDSQEVDLLLIRPGVHHFLRELSKLYELAIFTSSTQDFADWAIDIIDPHRYVKHRLYRQHVTYEEGSAVGFKDIAKLGRDLSRVIIIDNTYETMQLHPYNGVQIRTWTGDTTDTALSFLLPILQLISRKQVADVRVALSLMALQINAQLLNGVNADFEFILE